MADLKKKMLSFVNIDKVQPSQRPKRSSIPGVGEEKPEEKVTLIEAEKKQGAGWGQAIIE